MKSSGQKMKLYYLKQILEEHTDDKHTLSMSQIITLLSNFGIEAERKSIYTDMDILDDICGIERPQDTNEGYRILERPFELAEIKLLIDCVQSSKFLSEKKTRALIEKLSKQRSIHERQTMARQVVITNRVKSESSVLHYTVDALFDAIAQNKQIQFQYFTYNVAKEKYYYLKGAYYQVSPYSLIYTDDHYYLLVFVSEENKFKHFRVDHMENARVVDAVRDGAEEYKKLDMAAYNKYTFNMYGGDIERVTLVFSNHMMNAALDRFGHDIVPVKVDNRHFQITVPVAISQQFFGWVFSLGNTVRISQPEWVRQKMKDMLEEAKNRKDSD